MAKVTAPAPVRGPRPGARRRITTEFRLMNVALPVPQLIVLYPGQLAQFCRDNDLNYQSLCVRRHTYPERRLIVYRSSKTSSLEMISPFVMLPAADTQIFPPTF